MIEIILNIIKYNIELLMYNKIDEDKSIDPEIINCLAKLHSKLDNKSALSKLWDTKEEDEAWKGL